MRLTKYLGLGKPYDKARLRVLERRLVNHTYDLQGYYSVLRDFTPHMTEKIRLNQIWSEWKRLMEFLISERKPTRILEIGTGKAGSTYFLANLFGKDGTIITVDTSPISKEYVSTFQLKSQNLYCLNADSQDATTVQAVEQILDGHSLDLLYIDGDHSYEAVRKDFELYSRFCSDKSLIVFHDIIPDYNTSKGIATACYTGGVYKLWDELRAKFEHLEFVESPEQDGFGIGVLFYRLGDHLQSLNGRQKSQAAASQ